jgi:hypothetical protein
MCLIFQSAIRNLKSAIDFTAKLRNEFKMKTTRLKSFLFGYRSLKKSCLL